MYTYTSGYDEEEVFVPKGQVIGGAAIGIIVMGPVWYPLVPGNVANATTYNFPVYYKSIEAATNERVINPKLDPLVLKELIEAGKEMEQQGCRAITTGCGYFANYQPEVAAALNIPCFLSALMQIPIVSRALKPSQKVGVICDNGPVLLSAPALKNCGVDDPSTVVIGDAQDLPQLQNIDQNRGHLNNAKFEQELVDFARQMVRDNPDIGAFVFECSDFPPYSWAVQKAVRLPVFDYITMINWVYDAVVRRPFAGFM